MFLVLLCLLSIVNTPKVLPIEGELAVGLRGALLKKFVLQRLQRTFLVALLDEERDVVVAAAK